MIVIKLFKAVAVLTFFSVFNRVLGFLYKIVLSRTISTEMLGLYSIAISIFVVFLTAVGSGMPLTVSRQTAENNSANNKKKVYNVVTSSLIISFSLSVILTLVLVFSKNLFLITLKDNTVYYLLLSMLPALIFTGIYVPFRGYFWGKEEYIKASLVEAIEQIIKIVSCFALFHFMNNQNNIYATGIAISIACVLSTLLGLFLYFKAKNKLHYDKSTIKPLIKSSSTITFVRLAGSLMTPVLAILLTSRLIKSAGFTQEQSLSQLGIAMEMTLPLLSIPSTIIGALSMALIPKISSMMKDNQQSLVRKQVTSSVIFTLCCTFIVLPIFISMGQEISVLIFKNQDAGLYLQRASWLVIPLCLSQLSTSILNSMGLESQNFKHYLFSSLFLILAVFFLPKYAGIYALLYGLGVSSLIIASLNIYKINKKLHSKKYFIKEIITLILVCLPVILLTSFSFNLLNFVFPTIIAIGLASLLSLVAFVLVLSTSNVVDVSLINFKSITKLNFSKQKRIPILQNNTLQNNNLKNSTKPTILK